MQKSFSVTSLLLFLLWFSRPFSTLTGRQKIKKKSRSTFPSNTLSTHLLPSLHPSLPEWPEDCLPVNPSWSHSLPWALRSAVGVLHSILCLDAHLSPCGALACALLLACVYVSHSVVSDFLWPHGCVAY